MSSVVSGNPGGAQLPNLTDDNHHVTSPQDGTYNCVAWAVGDTTRWWWPNAGGGYYWPPGLSLVASLQTFRDAFESLGYEVADGDALEPGYEKVAVYCNDHLEPTHAARQLATGEWTSKLGGLEDLTHRTVGDLEGPVYGTAMLFLRRVVAPR